MTDQAPPDRPGQDSNSPEPITEESKGVTTARLEAMDKRATTFRKTAVAIYFGCMLVLFLLVLKTPLGTLWRSVTSGFFVGLFEGLGTSRASRQFYMDAAYLALLAGLLYTITRKVFKAIGTRIAATHPLNQELRGLAEEPRALVTHGLVSRHARGWVKFAATPGIITPAPGGWWRGFIVAFALTGLLKPALPNPYPSGGEPLLASGSTREAELALPGFDAILAGDPASGLGVLETAARRGREEAYAVLGQLHKNGSGTPKSTAEARRLWSEGVKRDDPSSSYFLALDLATANPEDPEERSHAYELAAEAEKTDHPERDGARILLGYMYINGFGTLEDTVAARRVLQNAYAGRSLRAARNLAALEDRAGNDRRAMEVTTTGAQAGFGLLQFWLARRYRNADGVPKDDQRAFYWALRAARQGNAEAQLMVGQLYHGGQGVAPNLTQAIYWFRLASEQGNALAMEWLGFALRSVRPIEAYVWYNLAVSRGQSSAAERRDQVAGRLTRQQVTAAQSFSSGWSEKEGVDGLRLQSGGTGFFVSPYHDIVTNEHVIGGCLRVAVQAGEKRWDDVTIVGANQTNDLALLRINLDEGERLVHPVARFAPRTSELGEELVVFGYPLSDMLSSSGVLNFGSLSANAGLGDDTTQIQISVPIQPGNSGGAVLDQSGRVVGVVVSTLNPVQQAQGTFQPQNVNFAIKGSVLREMLRQFGRDSYEAASEPDPKEGTVLGRIARSVSVQILCYGAPQI